MKLTTFKTSYKIFSFLFLTLALLSFHYSPASCARKMNSYKAYLEDQKITIKKKIRKDERNIRKANKKGKVEKVQAAKNDLERHKHQLKELKKNLNSI